MIAKKTVENYGRQHGKIKIAIAGAGYIAQGLVNQIVENDFIEVVAIASRNIDKINSVKEKHGLDHLVVLDQVEKLADQAVDIVIDLTGDVETGAKIAYTAIQKGIHVISSAETDATVGPALAELAREKGVMFSNMWGDEPGLIKSLYDYAGILGLEVVALGKFKGFHNVKANPDTVKPWADKSKQKASVISSFADGTKMSMEMTVVCNATGFQVDKPGMHLPTATLEEVPSILALEEEGGILSKKGIVEVVKGVQPSGGVYALVRCEDPQVIKSMTYYKMGDGPNYMLYIPYHMPGIEMIYGIYEMMILGQSTVEPKGRPYADAIAFAKKDLDVGDVLGELGGFEYYGEINNIEVSIENKALPLGLAKKAKVLRFIKEGQMISMDDVEIRDHDVCLMLRQSYGKLMEKYSG